MNKKALSLAVYMAISYPGAALALGLGEIESASHLNQPFKAKINLLSTNGSDLSKLRVKVASPSVFTRVGIDRPDYLNSLSFRSTIQGGKPVILVSSNQPIREPFINFLLEVSWPKGQLLKEYTVLLDPPVLMQPGTSIASNTVGVRPEPVSANQQRKQAAAVNEQQAARQQQQRQRVIAQQQQQRQQQLQRQQQAQNNASGNLRRPGAPLSQAAAGRVTGNTSKTYRVRSGDTLYKIANKIRHDGVRTEQMMMALFEANPTAFRKRNINNLKAGVVMRRPSVNEAKRVSVSQARRDVRAQMSQWNAQRKTAVASTKKAAPKKTAASTKATNAASTPDNSQQARIEVLGSTQGDASATNGNLSGKAKLDALNRQLTLASESLTARTHENNELKSRVSELESLLRKKNRLITLKNEQLAELQASLGKQPAGMATGNNDGDNGGEVIDPIAEQGDGIEQTIIGQEGSEGTILRTQDPAEAIINDPQSPEIFEPPVDEPTIDTAMNTPAQPKDEDSILDLLNSPLVMGLGAGSLLALIGGLLFMRRRNAKDEYDEYSPIDFDDPSLAPGSSGFEDDLNSEVTSADPGLDPFANPEEEKLESDFQADPMEELNAAEVAPAAAVAPTPVKAPVDVDAEEDDILQEADVYIVYGLHEQAEVELKKAIEKHPENLEYRAKLLENYHASDNKEAFEQAAAEFSQLQGPGKEALWDKVSSWGRKMLPGSALFAGSGGAAVASQMEQSAPAKTEPDAASGLGLAAGAAALGGVAITAGKAIADNTKEGAEAVSEAAESAVADLDDALTFEDDDLSAPAVGEDTQAEILDFDDMDLDSLLSADEESSENTVIDPETPEVAVEDSHDLADLSEVAAEPEDSSDIGEMEFDFSDFELDDEVAELPEQTAVAAVTEPESEITDDLTDLDDFSDLDLDLGESPEKLIKDLDSNDFDMANLNLALDGSDDGVGKILPDNSVYKMSGTEEDKEGDILGEIDDDLSFLDLDNAADDDMVETQVSTKLDLARAYMDMGDVDGARTTLEEVMVEGNDTQRKEAEALLQQTG